MNSPVSMIDLHFSITSSARSCVSRNAQQKLDQVFESNEGGNEGQVEYRLLSTGTETISLPQSRRREYRDFQERSWCPRQGDVAHCAFDRDNPFLRVLILGLRVDLEIDTSSSLPVAQTIWQSSQQRMCMYIHNCMLLSVFFHTNMY